MTDKVEEFKEEYLKELETNTCYQSRICKNPRKEHVVLLDGHRIVLNNKAIWAAKAYADRAVAQYIFRTYYGHGSSTQEKVWRKLAGDYRASCPAELFPVAEEIRKEFVKRVQVIPLMDYMVMQSRLSINKKKR